jgi:RND family efflux transporter MFP subunit
MTPRPLLLIPTLVALIACQDSTPKLAAAQAHTAEATIAQRLSWTAAQPATSQELIELLASVELSSAASHTLAPPLPARIVRWHVQPGQHIQQGQPLADLQIPDLQNLQRAATAAAQLVKTRRAQVQARATEVTAGVRDIAALREAEVALREATLALDTARGQLQAARPGAQLKPSGEQWRWESPVAGTVERIACSPGTAVTPQDTCLLIVEPDQSAARINVPERLISTLDTLTGATWLGPASQAVEVKIVRRASALDPVSRTLAVYLAPAQAAPSNTAWLPGMTGRIALRIAPTHADAVQVPRTAVIDMDGQPHVFVRGDADKPRPLKVERVGELGDSVIVRSENLRAGMEVVSRGTFLLKSAALLAEEG